MDWEVIAGMSPHECERPREKSTDHGPKLFLSGKEGTEEIYVRTQAMPIRVARARTSELAFFGRTSGAPSCPRREEGTRKKNLGQKWREGASHSGEGGAYILIHAKN